MLATKDKIKQVYDTLPQMNCGLCGFDNCGQFAKAAVEGRASPFGCRQDLWAGHRISEIMGIKIPPFGYPYGFGQLAFGRRPESLASIGSLSAEVKELSKRIEGILNRIDSLAGKKEGKVSEKPLRKEAINMPRGDGTGPAGRGPGTGRGLGRGGGRGRMGGRGLGVGGECVCPNCGYRTTHQVGAPCYEIQCPKCGTPMTR
jgi:hypothetical protein